MGEKRARRASLHMSVGDGMIGTPCKFRFANPVTGTTLAAPPETVFVVAYSSLHHYVNTHIVHQTKLLMTAI